MNLEFNKIFAALLVAGITAGSASFIARKIIHPHDLEKDAIPIEGVEVVAGAEPKKPKVAEPILHLLASADLARGEKLSKACAACHSFDKGGPNRIGPNLWNTIGSAKAHIPSFSYSDALASMGGTWGYVEMNKFLYKPKDYAPGTKMNYAGMKKPEDRAAIIAWLRTLHDSPLVLPSDVEISAEKAVSAPDDAKAAEVTPDSDVESTEAKSQDEDSEVKEDTPGVNAESEELDASAETPENMPSSDINSDSIPPQEDTKGN